MPPFSETDLDPDPIAQFAQWYERASEDVPLTDAMTLATVDDTGAPDARMVLLKGFGDDGFRFFTNLDSVKAQQMERRPEVALILFWRELDRQVRVRGPVSRLSEADSDEYFASRPRESQIGAWASPQSRPLPDRAALEARIAEIEERFEGHDVPRPPRWGGYIVDPRAIEFWQGQVGRLHDRFVYTRGAGRWAIERLGP
ncbi:pyridoxamine 5'-phosphate oxidase [Thermoleophilia bacterium SCSIO 60948]|nr:pyridoxamine 5'-phosphate oxidase [Thermoleophilia bacterium SCSIO 60948]